MSKLFATLATLLALASAASALERDEVLVVYNENFEGSKALALYYAERRQIPMDHVVGIMAGVVERLDRAAYFDTVQRPIRAWMDVGDHAKKIRCILLMRGVPLLFGPVENKPAAQARSDTHAALTAAENEKKKLEAERKQLQDEMKAQPARAAELRPKIDALNEKLAKAEADLKPLKEAADKAETAWQAATYDTAHSVDSSLSVMYYPNVPVKRWVLNSLYYRTWSLPGRNALPRTFLTCRLDGPSDALVKRIIDDSIEAEAKGLEGTAYFDANDDHPGKAEKNPDMMRYDESIRRAARMVESAGMKTVLDDTPKVFAPGTCPDAALYCGWYSLRTYVPACTWVKGAVGFHVASWEAETLRDPNFTGWVPKILEAGASATFGPTWEPFIQAFPDPSPFFAFLLTGRYTLAEAYWYTTPMASWTLVLIADPLYTPFKKDPKMTISRLKEILEEPPAAVGTAPGKK